MISLSEIRNRALKFQKEWEGEKYERDEAQSFWNDFFQIFDISRHRVAMFEEPIKKLGGSQGFIDLNFLFLQDITDKQREQIETLAQTILDARAQFPDNSLADLYNPLTMPPKLLKAHEALDKAVDELYRREEFKSDTERVAHLFELNRGLTSLVGEESGKKTKK